MSNTNQVLKDARDYSKNTGSKNVYVWESYEHVLYYSVYLPENYLKLVDIFYQGMSADEMDANE